MNSNISLEKIFLYMVILTLAANNCLANTADSSYIKLPLPQMEGGMPLMQALKERKSTREFSSKELPLQVLSNLLWAAYGVNRPEKGARTAPSAHNVQEIDIYVAKSDGLFLYNARSNSLELVVDKDIRKFTGKQSFVAQAPVNLIYVADMTRANQLGEKKDFYPIIDTGFIAQNVYLFCASEGLACVVRGMFDENVLKREMKLRDNQKIIITQTVGYPK